VVLLLLLLFQYFGFDFVLMVFCPPFLA